MKYAVKLRKIVERTVIVDATSDEEADKKLLAREIEAEYSTVINANSYDNWEYISHKEFNDEEIIRDADELAKKIFGSSKSSLERDMFKYTICGACCEYDAFSFTIIGYVEGLDYGYPSETLYFPFSVSEYETAMERIEKEADRLWREVNESEED